MGTSQINKSVGSIFKTMYWIVRSLVVNWYLQKSWTPYSNHDSNGVRGIADNNQGDGIKLQVVVRPSDAHFFTLNFVSIG